MEMEMGNNQKQNLNEISQEIKDVLRKAAKAGKRFIYVDDDILMKKCSTTDFVTYTSNLIIETLHSSNSNNVVAMALLASTVLHICNVDDKDWDIKMSEVFPKIKSLVDETRP